MGSPPAPVAEWEPAPAPPLHEDVPLRIPSNEYERQVSLDVPPVRPFRTPSSYFSEEFSSPGLVAVAAVLLASALASCAALAGDSPGLRALFEVCAEPDVHGDGPACRSEPWKALVVGHIVLLAVVAMAQGWRSEFVLLTSVVIFGLLGIISTEKALAGFSNSGTMVIQGMLILVQGIQDSGVLGWIFTIMLGMPRGRSCALLRLQALACLLSAFVSTGPVCFAFLRPLALWAPQVGLTPREALMPFVAAGLMGQTLLLISSPVSVLVASRMPSAGLTLTDPAPICVLLSAITCAYGILGVGPLLGPGRQREAASLEPPHVKVIPCAPEVDPGAICDGYVVEFQVGPSSMLIGRSLSDGGLLKVRGAVALGGQFDRPLAPGDSLLFTATAAGVARLRTQGHGLRLKGANTRSSTEVLGGRRHERLLFEAVVRCGSPLEGGGLPRQLPQAVCLAARRPSHAQHDSLEGAAPEFRGPLQAGDVLLVEAFSAFPELPEVRRSFASVAAVPDSSPPRHGRDIDTRRGWLAVALLVSVLLLALLRVGELVLLVLGVCTFCVLFNVVHRNRVLGIVNLPLYILIASGIGVGEAMADSGLAGGLAQLMVRLGLWSTGGSPYGVMIALSAVTSMLSNMMSNTATAALMTPIVKGACEQQGMNLKTGALLLIFSSNSAFSTPFATAMGPFIQEVGPYRFGDFVRFGVPLQLLLAVCIPVLCVGMCGLAAEPAGV